MNGGWRTVILEDSARVVLDAAIHKYPELEAVYEGLEWRVSRTPQTGYAVKGTSPQAYLLRSKEWLAPVSLVLLYTFTDDDVTVKAVRLRETEPDEPKKYGEDSKQ
jgi:hypothetical protein